MKSTLLCVIALLYASSVAASEIGMSLLPKGRPFRMTFADPREIKMALDFGGDSRVNASIGNYFSLFAIRPVEGSNWDLHFGLEGAGYFTMKKLEDRFPLETADGTIGTYLEGHISVYQWQVRITHTSAHLADGFDQVERDATPYSREYITWRNAIIPYETVQVYGGFSYLLNSHPPDMEPFTFQTGLTAFVPSSTQMLVPFIGLDFKWKQESAYNPSFSAHLGLALSNPMEAYRSFRFFYHYFTGADPRGKFYANLITTHSFGIEMQI